MLIREKSLCNTLQHFLFVNSFYVTRAALGDSSQVEKVIKWVKFWCWYSFLHNTAYC